MLRKDIITQVLIVAVGQLLVGETAPGITLIEAEQQVRARSAYMYWTGSEPTEQIAVLELDPDSPQGIGDADLQASASMYGASGSASLVSSFIGDQIAVSSSTDASATWGSAPETAYGVHGNGRGRFWLSFTTGPSAAYIHIDGVLNVGVYGYPDLYPEQARTWVRLETIDDGSLIQIWEAALDGADAQTSLQMDHGLLLEADRDYYLVALAESSIPAASEWPNYKSRAASFSLTATFTCIVPVPDVLGITEADAQSTLEAAGLAKGVVTYDQSEEVPAGHVMAQNPDAGTLVDCDAAVDLVVSYGQEVLPLPDLVGEFGRVSFRTPLGPRDMIRTQIVVTNIGLAAVARKQVIDIQIRLRPCGAIGDSQDILVMELPDQSVSGLRSGASKKFRVTTLLPLGLDEGEYRLVAELDSSNDVAEWIEANNTALSECFHVVGE